MKYKWLLSAVIILFSCLLFFVESGYRDSAAAMSSGSEKIERSLIDQISTQGGSDYIVRFIDQADLTPAYDMNWIARGEFVYNTLKQTAENSQANAKSILDTQGIHYQSFIAGNDLFVFASYQANGTSTLTLRELATINTLAALPEVSSIRAPQMYSIDPTIDINPLASIQWAGDFLADHVLTSVVSVMTGTTDWGITDTKADQFWSTFGIKGVGIKVASIDTGVQWNHPALVNQFACPGDPGNPACWSDPENGCGGTACDNNGHGTHTMGTMIAKDNPALPYIAGMAPDASWIACKACSSTNCSEFALNSCANWILAPAGNPANRPNVVNNSWGGGAHDPWYQANVQAWRAAGIFPAFSAGNSGNNFPSCSTLTTPGDYQESFTTTAHDSLRNVAGFSSTGPSLFGSSPYTKPNISAPGVSICSTFPGNLWTCAYNGTSMASPHSAGAVALLWSCNPALSGQVDATFRVLQDNADPSPAGKCNAVPPAGQGNYTYGYGYLDVLSAGKVTCNFLDKYAINQVMRPNETKTISLSIYNHGVVSLNWSLQESSLAGLIGQQSTFPEVTRANISNLISLANAETGPMEVSTSSWITESPQSGTILPDQHAEVTISFNTNNLSAGVYQTRLLINNSSPFPPVLSVPVTLMVGEATYLPIITKR